MPIGASASPRRCCKKEAPMELELGQHILSSDGQDIGTIKHLVLDPASGRVKTFVVEKGRFFPDDIEIPLEAVVETRADGLTLRTTAEQSRHMPRFEEGQYRPITSPELNTGMHYPVGGMLLPNGYATPPVSNSGLPLFMPIVDGQMAAHPLSEQDARLQHLDATNAVISAGDEIFSQDMEKVGEVQSIAFDSVTGRPIRLVVRQGWLFYKDWELSAASIAGVDDGVVYLRENKARLHHRREEELYTTEWGLDHKPDSRW
jgi:sporulation protein YlmC with PRC-barrel domain